MPPAMAAASPFDNEKRSAALEGLFVAEPVVFEPNGVVRGRPVISEVAGALLKQFGPDFRFIPYRPAALWGTTGWGYYGGAADPTEARSQ